MNFFDLFRSQRERQRREALKLFEQKDYAAAIPIFKSVAQESNDTADWFNLIVPAVYSGDIELSKSAYDRTMQCQEDAGWKQQPSAPFIRYYYACALRDVERFSEALDPLRELRISYEKLKITDDTFMYMRGVPFLTQTLDVAVDVFNGLNDEVAGRNWLESLSSQVDADGKQACEEAVAKLTGGS